MERLLSRVLDFGVRCSLRVCDVFRRTCECVAYFVDLLPHVASPTLVVTYF